MVTNEGRVIYKVNQDRGLIYHPALNAARLSIFGVFDGERNGKACSVWSMHRMLCRRQAT